MILALLYQIWGKWQQKNEKSQKVMDFDENWFFPINLDPLISGKILPGAKKHKNEEKQKKIRKKLNLFF